MSSTAARQAASLASGSASADRAPAADSAPEMVASRVSSASISDTAAGAEPGQFGEHQPAQIGIDDQTVRHAVTGEPAGEPLRAPVRDHGAGVGLGERELVVRAGLGSGQQRQ